MTTHAARHPSRRTAHGFSLVELMVGLAVGMVLIAGLALLFANTSNSGNELNKSIRQIENGRYAVQLLEDDIAHAGYYGEVPLDGLKYIAPTAITDLCTNAAGSWNAALSQAPAPIVGISATDATTLSATCLPNYLTGTPALALRRVSTDSISPASVPASQASIYVQTSRCSTDPLNKPFVVSATTSDFTLLDQKCVAKNSVRQYVSRIYYIASCNECAGSSADSTPTLKMAELQGASMVTVPLVEGIENMALEYGFDTTTPPDGIPDIFLSGLSGTAGAPDNNWANAVAVRLHLLSRTTEPSPGTTDTKTYVLKPASSIGPFNDSYKRRVYTTTVRLSNVAGPLEVPASTPASAP